MANGIIAAEDWGGTKYPTFDNDSSVMRDRATDRLLRIMRQAAAEYLRASTDDAIDSDHADLLRSAFASLADLAVAIHERTYGKDI